MSLRTARFAQGSRRKRTRLIEIRQFLDVVLGRPMGWPLLGLTDGPGSFHQRPRRPLAENPGEPRGSLQQIAWRGLASSASQSQSTPHWVLLALGYAPVKQNAGP